MTLGVIKCRQMIREGWSIA